MRLLSWSARFIPILLLIVAACAATTSAVQSQDAPANNSNSLVLNAYIDQTGRALVTGYADAVDGLPFLNESQYQYDNDTKQLYALTNTLTYKSGEDWGLEFSAKGYYEGYHVVFYLPGDVMLGRINCSRGLEFLLSTSNQSFMVDIQGYGVLDPDVTLAFRQPLESAPASSIVWYRQNAPAFALVIVIVLASGLLIWRKPKFRKTGVGDLAQTPLKNDNKSDELEPKATDDVLTSDSLASPKRPDSAGGPAPAAESATSEPLGNPPTDEDIIASLSSGGQGLPSLLGGQLTEEDIAPQKEEDSEAIEAEDGDIPEKFSPTDIGVIKVTSEMAAVMETLTAREKAVLTALIEHNGRMTQADIRYETEIPKSSLTGILISLERRKLLIKKEWGRTNVIELSDSFLGRKERF